MKKLILLCLCLSLYLIVQAQVSKTINIATAGTLGNLLTATEKTTITNLTVTGNIDARDVKCMGVTISKLNTLDISAAIIQAYNGTDGTDFENNTTIYPANEMPAFSFFPKYHSLPSPYQLPSPALALMLFMVAIASPLLLSLTSLPL